MSDETITKASVEQDIGDGCHSLGVRMSFTALQDDLQVRAPAPSDGFCSTFRAKDRTCSEYICHCEAFVEGVEAERARIEREVSCLIASSAWICDTTECGAHQILDRALEIIGCEGEQPNDYKFLK